MDAGRAYDAAHPAEYDAVIDRITPQTLATLLYTSGTTGRPKGVELVHDCWLYEAEAIDELDLLREDDLQYLWLPLSHSFGKVLEGAQVRIGFVTGHRRPRRQARREPRRGEADVRGRRAARLREGPQQGRDRRAGGGRPEADAIFNWAMSASATRSRSSQQGGQEPDGLARAASTRSPTPSCSRSCATGSAGGCGSSSRVGAPLSREVAEFFHAADILIAEGYGLTETSAASFVNVPRPDRRPSSAPSARRCRAPRSRSPRRTARS